MKKKLPEPNEGVMQPNDFPAALPGFHLTKEERIPTGRRDDASRAYKQRSRWRRIRAERGRLQLIVG